VAGGNARANQLHGRTSHIVKAATQAQLAEVLKPHLSEEEADIYRRGRNAKSPTMAKNATMSDYRSATGFEALIGYLYLTDSFARIVELTKSGLSELNIKP
jgi:ribonuclease-3 family protein